MLFAMAERDDEDIEAILLCVTMLLACAVGVLFECWKGNQLGQWEPLRLTGATLGCVAAGVFLVVRMRRPRS